MIKMAALYFLYMYTVKSLIFVGILIFIDFVDILGQIIYPQINQMMLVYSTVTSYIDEFMHLQNGDDLENHEMLDPRK